MDSSRMRTAIEKAVSVPIGSIDLHGIVDDAVRSVAISPKRLQQLATQLERDGQTEVELSAQIEFFLRVSNRDSLSSTQCVPFRVKVSAHQGDLQAVASAEKAGPRLGKVALN